MKLQVSTLEDRERRLAGTARAALKDLADQNAKLGRAIEQNEDLAFLILHGLKYYLNSYLRAALEHSEHIKDTTLPFKQELLICAQVELEVARSVEEIIREEGGGFFTEAIARKAKESLMVEVRALEAEIVDLQQQADQMLLRIQEIEGQIREKDLQIMAGIGQLPDKEALRLTHDSVELKIRSFTAQIDMLDFKREKLMPKQQQRSTLRMILGSIPELNEFTVN
jgi:prefoldin subunit 5